MPFKPGKSGNPKGRPRKEISLDRTDSWTNALTGLGYIGQDKRISTLHRTASVTYFEAEDLWRGNDLAARIIETVPNEMLRQGFEYHDENDKGTEELVTDKWDELDVYQALWCALTYEAAYGGSAILLGANDGTINLAKPLNIERVRSFDWLTVLEPRELTPTQWYNDPRAPKFGKPEIYQLNPVSSGGGQTNATIGTTYVHESRLIIFPGIRVSRRQTTELTGWGDSRFTRINPVLRDFGLSWTAVGTLVADFAQAVFKIDGLANIIANDQSELFKARMQAVDLSRSVLRAVVIDSNEEFERKATPVAGLPDLLDRFATRLAAAADMPLTLLMGQSPAGLNATGDSDIRFFYDRVKAMQHRKLKPAVEKITELILASNPGLRPEYWSIEFCPLWQPTQKEKAETRLLIAQSDQIYLANGVVSPEEVALSRFGGDDYSIEMSVDFAAREALEPAAPEPVMNDPMPDPNNTPNPDIPVRAQNTQNDSNIPVQEKPVTGETP